MHLNKLVGPSSDAIFVFHRTCCRYLTPGLPSTMFDVEVSGRSHIDDRKRRCIPRVPARAGRPRQSASELG